MPSEFPSLLTKTASCCMQRLAEAVLSTPVAAMGVLHLIGSCVGRKSYWRETYRVLAAPAFLNLLSVIVARQPLMHEKVRILVFRTGACLMRMML